MRIGIDARFYGFIGKGLGRYTQKLIENLEKIDKINQYFIFLIKDNIDEYEPKSSNFKKVLADYRWYTLSEQVKLPFLLKKYKLDLMHFPHFNIPIFYRKKFIVTIHDLILIHFPTVKGTTLNPIIYWMKFLLYKIVIKSAIIKSEAIIAVSQFTKNDILRNYKINPKKIEVTYEACDDYCMLSPNIDNEILSRYGIIKPYIMYVGNAYPHKNLEGLVLAFKKLRENSKHKDTQLALVGKEDYFYNKLKSFVIKHEIKNVVFTGYVPDYELDIFFHNVALYVWPSLYEGFGLSPLEAMAKGAPVISSDHPCMREILGDSVYYFDGTNIDEMTAAIDIVLSNPKIRRDLIKRGYDQIRKYSWKRMAIKTLDIYTRIFDHKK